MTTPADQKGSAAKPAAIIALLACATTEQRQAAFDQLHRMPATASVAEIATAIEWATKGQAPARRATA